MNESHHGPSLKRCHRFVFRRAAAPGPLRPTALRALPVLKLITIHSGFHSFGLRPSFVIGILPSFFAGLRRGRSVVVLETNPALLNVSPRSIHSQWYQ